MPLPAADRGDYQDFCSVPGGRAEPVEIPDILAVDEHVYVPPHASLLVHDAVERRGSLTAERHESIANSSHGSLED